MISISKFLSICDDGTILPYPAGQGNTRSRIITAAIDDKGKVSIYTYQLTFKSSSGYQAYLIYGVDDTAKTVKTIITKTNSLLKSVADGFKK